MSFGEIPQPKKLNVDPSELELLDPKKPRVASGELSEEEIKTILFDADAKLAKDPETKLTQLEASLVYQIDKDLEEEQSLQLAVKAMKHVRGFRKGMSDEQLRNLPDYEQVKSLIRLRLESEKNIVDTSTALQQVMKNLGVEGYTHMAYYHALKGYEDKEGNKVIGKLDDWEERGVFDYLTIELIKNNNRHNIVPVPNPPEGQEFSEEQIVGLARKFGKQPDGAAPTNGITQPYETYFVDDYNDDPEEKLYNKYSREELGGASTEGPIRLSLVPSKLTEALDNQTVEQQVATLAKMQQAAPSLNFHVSDTLTAIAHWYVLRAGGDKLADSTAFYKTFIRQFMLKPQLFGGYPYVPNSYVSSGGRPRVSCSSAATRVVGRVSVGDKLKP